MASGIRRSARSARTARTARSPRPSHRITRGVLSDPIGAASAPSGPAGRVSPPTFGGDPSAAGYAAYSPNDAILPHAAVPPPPPRTHHIPCAPSRTRTGAAVSAVAAPSPRGQAALLEGVDPPAGGDATAPAVAAPRPRSRAALPLVSARPVRVAVATPSLRDRAALPLAVTANARGGAAAAAGVLSLPRGRAALPPRAAAPNAHLGRAGGMHGTPPPSRTRTARIDSSAETDEMELYMRASTDTWTESDGTGISLAAACHYLVPVSLSFLKSPDTHRHEFLALCEARALPGDTNASKAVLRARLVAFSLSTRTVWCARVQLLAKHVWRDALVDWSHTLPFLAAIAHRVSVPASFEAPSLISQNPPRLPLIPLMSVGAPAAAYARRLPVSMATVRAEQPPCASSERSPLSPPALPPPPPALPRSPPAHPPPAPAPQVSSAGPSCTIRAPSTPLYPALPTS